jgi:hypothetical protein
MRILKFDEFSDLSAEDFVGDKTAYTSYPYLKESWTVPFVTGKKYKVSWGNNGLDWDQLQVKLSERWAPTDKNIYFVHNFTDVREKMEV